MGRKLGGGRTMYAVYKGDTFLACGTCRQLAERFGVKPATVYWWSYPANHRLAERDCSKGRKVAFRV